MLIKIYKILFLFVAKGVFEQSSFYFFSEGGGGEISIFWNRIFQFTSKITLPPKYTLSKYTNWSVPYSNSGEAGLSNW